MACATRVLNTAATFNGHWRFRSVSRLGSIDHTICARYTVELSKDMGAVTGTLNYYSQSKVSFTDNPNVNPNGNSPGYSVANARIDWSNMFGRPLDGAIFVRNLFDKDYTIYRGDSAASVGVAYYQWAEPRTFGVEMRYRFGASR